MIIVLHHRKQQPGSSLVPLRPVAPTGPDLLRRTARGAQRAGAEPGPTRQRAPPPLDANTSWKRDSVHQHLLEAIPETADALESRQKAFTHQPLRVVVYRIALPNRCWTQTGTPTKACQPQMPSEGLSNTWPQTALLLSIARPQGVAVLGICGWQAFVGAFGCF